MMPRELDYGMIGADGTLEAEPGLWLHVVRVASVQADMALNELLNGTEIYRSHARQHRHSGEYRAGNHRRGDQPAVYGGLGDGRTRPALSGLRQRRAGSRKRRWTIWWK